MAQGPNETLDAFVAGGEAVLIDEILVDRRGVPMQLHLGSHKLLVWRARRQLMCTSCRWSGWGNLRLRAGGHRGGVCLLGGGKLRLIPPNRLAIDAGDPGDLPLTLARGD